MDFSAFAVATLPDVNSARRLHDLDDLDDDGVVKVMLHHARQRRYPPGTLAPEQQRVAALTLAYAGQHGARLDTLSLADSDEVQMLKALCEAIALDRPLLYWNTGALTLRMLNHRMFLHGLECPAYWSAQRGQDSTLIDVGERLRGESMDYQDLDELARSIGLPGLMGFSADAVQACSEPGEQDPAPYSEVPALNLLLIGARQLLISGDLTSADAARLQSDVRSLLAGASQAHRAAFLERWEGR